jgi:hypothetical protein
MQCGHEPRREGLDVEGKNKQRMAAARVRRKKSKA